MKVNHGDNCDNLVIRRRLTERKKENRIRNEEKRDRVPVISRWHKCWWRKIYWCYWSKSRRKENNLKPPWATCIKNRPSDDSSPHQQQDTQVDAWLGTIRLSQHELIAASYKPRMYRPPDSCMQPLVQDVLLNQQTLIETTNWMITGADWRSAAAEYERSLSWANRQRTPATASISHGRPLNWKVNRGSRILPRNSWEK